mmetsp:Transcript_30957/g.81020  ORF Transcript_30957/g.81020 Transcript_30957/m.81020 type:complete len:259 (+) Transcript_30957:24-800(+)|eukprot:CAMPEP_0182927362 /NCGR_PEP_ID=MMETSP0105_2-20130417/13746_1 /TAXON_ID=81532 ORGANISM="Acanthoeca-like sp., Strain 10tr" /NCGR_SAMPLE_ID=MMETSP0105_2 /ASSEMBLY_ACC=CAM_ASM_000205 /LENGTH=258 /DNA_ID=CAMNT_0025065307 /DNA_START=24 /DNA_END=800 /DNA_ORIENTATION=-
MDKVFVRSLSGKVVAVAYPVDGQLRTLRQSIEDTEGVPADDQILRHGGRLLGHAGEAGLSGGGDVTLTVALRGGGRGRSNHKGRRRHFTAGPEEIDEEKAAKAEKWNARQQGRGGDGMGDVDEEDEGSDEDGPAAAAAAAAPRKTKPVKVDQYGIPITDDEDDEDDDEDEDAAPAAPELSRREREEIEKQEADRKYQALHAAGKTEEYQKDFERLQKIRQEREEAKAKREEMAALKAQKKAALPVGPKQPPKGKKKKK